MLWKTSFSISVSACCLALASFGCSDSSVAFSDLPACGNGKTDGAEVCDGDSLGEATCLSVAGLDSGTLSCNDDCTAYVTDECATCGNGVQEGSEFCDGDSVGEATCLSVAGLDSGTLVCNDACTAYVTDECATCGNGVQEASEVCDGESVGEATCLSEASLDSGALGCNDDCTALVTDQCFTCGNDTIEGPELCDGADLGSATCESAEGQDEGTITCNATCDSYVTENCHICGDGKKEADEDCDQEDFGGADCSTVEGGFAPGALTCTSECKIETTSCTLCGNGVIDEGEQCDGSDLNDLECTTAPGDQGFMGGDLSCDPTSCQLVTSACHKCGNNQPDGDEECDDGDDLDNNACTNSCMKAFCGDGILRADDDSTEECDDGVGNNSDTEPNACRTSCLKAHCGDAVMDSGEVCEPGLDDHCCETDTCALTRDGGSDPQGVCLEKSQQEGKDYLCDGAGECRTPTVEEEEPMVRMDGLPEPTTKIYYTPEDCPAERLKDGDCHADRSDRFRALMGFPIRNEEALEESIARIYNPSDLNFRLYMTPSEWNDVYAPHTQDFNQVVNWLKLQGFAVDYQASNRLLVQFKGTVGQFNDAFQADLLDVMRHPPQGGNDPFLVYATKTGAQFTVPKYVSDRVNGVITADKVAEVETIDPETGENYKLKCEYGEVFATEPKSDWLGSMAEFRSLYGAEKLYSDGYQGQGVKLGVVVGASFKLRDVRSFWRSMGLCETGVRSPLSARSCRDYDEGLEQTCLANSEGFNREDPSIEDMMEPANTRYIESVIDIEYAGGLAPKADLIIYQGPDARNTSMVYTWNEAIAKGEASVLTTSFAHRENSEPLPVRHQYHSSSMMGAALGITLVAASGDRAKPDTPSSSPYVTGVGGTLLQRDDEGNRTVAQEAYSGSGSGLTRTFALPYWQVGIDEIENDPLQPINDPGTAGNSLRPELVRAVVDVATSATGYPVVSTLKFEGGGWKDCTDNNPVNWCSWGGTSFSSPLFAGLVALINSQRVAEGLPVVGFLNPLLYLEPSVQAAFWDVTEGTTSHAGVEHYTANEGWDYPTGWGVPNVTELAAALKAIDDRAAGNP